MKKQPYDAQRIGSAINLALGVWLSLSTFLWPHLDNVRLNTVVMGVVIAAFALAALAARGLSWVDAIPAWWLLSATLYLKHAHCSTWLNNAVVGALVFVASLLPVALAPPSPPIGASASAGTRRARILSHS